MFKREAKVKVGETDVVLYPGTELTLNEILALGLKDINKPLLYSVTVHIESRDSVDNRHRHPVISVSSKALSRHPNNPPYNVELKGNIDLDITHLPGLLTALIAEQDEQDNEKSQAAIIIDTKLTDGHILLVESNSATSEARIFPANSWSADRLLKKVAIITPTPPTTE